MKRIFFKVTGLVVNLAFIVALMYQFSYVVPWLDAEPIEMVKYSGLEYQNIPAEAKSFSTDKTYAVFHEHGTIKQEPLKFSAHVLAFLLTLLFANLAHRYFKAKST